MRNLLCLCLLPLLFSGCAFTTQYFREELREYDSETGWLISEHVIKGRNITMAPPFGSEAIAEHRLWMEQDISGSWIIEMGSESDVLGGDASKSIKAIVPLLTTPLFP